MYIFKSRGDLSRLQPGSRSRFLIGGILDRLIQAHSLPRGYKPEDHGYVVLIDALDVPRPEIVPELPIPLAQVPWEGVTLVNGHFHAVVLTNNSFGIDFLIPNETWLPLSIRKALEGHLSI